MPRSLNESSKRNAKTALEFANQAKKLGFQHPDPHNEEVMASEAVEAKFVTSQDPVIETANGDRLPAVPVNEAVKLNQLKNRMQGKDSYACLPPKGSVRESKDGALHGLIQPNRLDRKSSRVTTSELPGAPLPDAVPPTKTNPLFPPLPVYGPPSLLRDLQCFFFRATSFVLSLCFLSVVCLGAIFTSLPLVARRIWARLKLQDPDATRPFFAEERERMQKRRQTEQAWQRQANVRERNGHDSGLQQHDGVEEERFPAREGGPDPVVCDVGYYARRAGLDAEEFDVQTEDGFVIKLYHMYDPNEYTPVHPSMRQQKSARVFGEESIANGRSEGASGSQYKDGRRRFPVLLMHGLLQSAGAFCCTDDKSLAFILAKAGYDVWLGNNRCGFKPEHNVLSYKDPQMWAWNIRQMGVMDLAALISRVLEETGLPKTGLVCHSQGTTETFVALAKEQRPELGGKISVFCALAPAVYAGPLIKKFYLKIMRLITPAMFRLVFGIHAFIPFMMQMHAVLPTRLYGFLGYHVFSFLFGWTDERWERDVRDRMFQFSPSYTSSESMRWWLGRECFATQKCILSTRAEGKIEDKEDSEEDQHVRHNLTSEATVERSTHGNEHDFQQHGRYAWYDERAPPFAFWIAGSDDLVDGRRLMRRFERGREPFVDLVHCKVIEEYEHLDVIWAMDSSETVAKEVAEVIWKTASEESRALCRTPVGCQNVEPWTPMKSSPSPNDRISHENSKL